MIGAGIAAWYLAFLVASSSRGLLGGTPYLIGKDHLIFNCLIYILFLGSESK